MFEYKDYHKYVGTSLSKCVVSIFKGEMDYDNVIGMITNTRLKDWETVLSCVERYIDGDDWGYGYWMKYADRRDEILELVWDMWHYKPFYQPRLEHGFVLVGEPNTRNFFRDMIWIRAEEDSNSPWHTQEAVFERISNGDRDVLGMNNQEEEE